jgi:hypothetical protein
MSFKVENYVTDPVANAILNVAAAIAEGASKIASASLASGDRIAAALESEEDFDDDDDDDDDDDGPEPPKGKAGRR